MSKTGTCVNCRHCLPKEKRWCGTHYGCGCSAVEDGVHKTGWGNVKYNPDESIKRKENGLLDLEKCFYWKTKEEFEQLNLFE